MVNLDQICKVEVMGDYYRLYLVSGDVEEVDKKTFMSAIQSSGAQFMTFSEEPQTATFDNIDNDDVEDVTGLSSGDLVPESDLAAPASNSWAEGSDVVDPRDVLANMSKDQLLRVLATLKAE